MFVPCRRLRRGIAVRLRAKVARLFGGVMSQYASMPAGLPLGTCSCTYPVAFGEIEIEFEIACRHDRVAAQNIGLLLWLVRRTLIFA